MELVRFEPFARAGNFRSLFNELFDENLGRSSARRTARQWHPAVDVLESKDAFLIRAELPGMKREEIKVEVKDGNLATRESPCAATTGARALIMPCCWSAIFFNTRSMPSLSPAAPASPMKDQRNRSGTRFSTQRENGSAAYSKIWASVKKTRRHHRAGNGSSTTAAIDPLIARAKH